MAITDQAGSSCDTITPAVAKANDLSISGSSTGMTVQAESNVAKADTTDHKMTLRQFRQLRAKYFTIRHQRMEPCGHRLDQITEPRNNCEFCWFAFFQTHGELVQTADRAYQEQGAEFLDKMRGVKWRKMFLRFMSTVAMFEKEIATAKEKDGQANENQSSDGAGQDAGQNLQHERNFSTHGETSGPTQADLSNPITVV